MLVITRWYVFFFQESKFSQFSQFIEVLLVIHEVQSTHINIINSP